MAWMTFALLERFNAITNISSGKRLPRCSISTFLETISGLAFSSFDLRFAIVSLGSRDSSISLPIFSLITTVIGIDMGLVGELGDIAEGLAIVS